MPLLSSASSLILFFVGWVDPPSLERHWAPQYLGWAVRHIQVASVKHYYIVDQESSEQIFILFKHLNFTSLVPFICQHNPFLTFKMDYVLCQWWQNTPLTKARVCLFDLQPVDSSSSCCQTSCVESVLQLLTCVLSSLPLLLIILHCFSGFWLPNLFLFIA